MKTTDEQILTLVQQPEGMEEGFRLLVMTYQERLYQHVRRIVIEHEDANDVVQNVFVKAFRNIGRFQGKAALYTWLYRIATNEAITFVKQRQRKRSEALDGEGLNLAEQLTADPWFDGDTAQLRLQQALQTLPEKQRTVFQLRYFEELSYKELSKILDTSVGGLKASYHHAVKKIEHFINPNT